LERAAGALGDKYHSARRRGEKCRNALPKEKVRRGEKKKKKGIIAEGRYSSKGVPRRSKRESALMERYFRGGRGTERKICKRRRQQRGSHQRLSNAGYAWVRWKPAENGGQSINVEGARKILVKFL